MTLWSGNFSVPVLSFLITPADKPRKRLFPAAKRQKGPLIAFWRNPLMFPPEPCVIETPSEMQRFFSKYLFHRFPRIDALPGPAREDGLKKGKFRCDSRVNPGPPPQKSPYMKTKGALSPDHRAYEQELAKYDRLPISSA
jgi:hypothetical protein